jgi:hypothetical protein
MSQFTNPQLQELFAAQLPTVNGTSSPAILAEFGSNDQGPWALVVQFEAREETVNDPFSGPTVQMNIITKRAMVNCPEDMLKKLQGLPTYPVLEGLSIVEDYTFVAEDAPYPVSAHVLKYGPAVYTNSSGMACFNANGEILVVTKAVCKPEFAGDVKAFPKERLTSLHATNDKRLSKREAFFASWKATHSVSIQVPTHIEY